MATKRRSLLASKENVPPSPAWNNYEDANENNRNKTSPTPPRSKPYQGRTAAMKDHWENFQPETEATRDSPMLAQLKDACAEMNRPAMGAVYAAQRELVRKHYEAKSRIDGISGIGGGVSMWPAMDDMRLSRGDTLKLFLICVGLLAATVAVFHSFHGAHISKLQLYTSRLRDFPSLHPLSASDPALFHRQLLEWHQGFLLLQDSIHSDFYMEWSQCSLVDITFLLLYIIGIIALLYFLVDNMFSKSRLTPRRIKSWISLLVVVMTWTILSVYLLVCAQAVETATQHTIHDLSSKLAHLVQTPLDLTQYHSVLLYWRTRCLPPTARGVLSIMGLLQVQDVAYYLQYYSLPILTAICTPIVKIVMSLRTVYNQ